MSQSVISQIQVSAPPPPPQNHSTYSLKLDTSKSTYNSTAKRQFELSECKWAVQYPEVQRAFYFGNVCTVSAPIHCKYYEIEPITQVGPTCGLTALSMIFNGVPSPGNLLAYAKTHNYSNNGEMFSAHNLLKIFNEFLHNSKIDIEGNSVRAFIYDGNMNDKSMKDLIKEQEALVLFA